MKKLRVGINGFGRIGRGVLRSLERLESPSIEVVHINDSGDLGVLSHLFEFDSVHGRWLGNVTHEKGFLVLNDRKIAFSHCQQIENIGWQDVDVVIEATGRFKTRSSAEKHLQAGAPRVIISAVADEEDIPTIVMGSNHTVLDGSENVISNASCTTNCSAPLVDVIDKRLKIESGYITTVHSYTSDQRLHDGPHKDYRRARAGAVSIIPTTTGAAKAITKIFPHLDGHLGGAGIRVPVPNGSLTDITYIVQNKTSVEEVNQWFKDASEAEPWKGRLEYTEKPIVSVDVIGSPYSCIFDAQLTSVIGNMVKVVGWYDNEMGYSNRLIDLINYCSRLWD